jgi:membrane fusion protein (multidrug efflux system)
MKKTLIIGGIVAVIAIIALRLISNKKTINENKQVVDRSQIPVSVTVASVEEKAINSSFQLPATLNPFEESIITSTVAGKITQLTINNGSHVGKGQIIGSIDSELKKLNLEATELSASKLKRDYERSKELFEGKAATETSVIDAKYAYDNKRIEADQLRKQISDANIVAPFNGIISNKNLNIGEFANIGATIASIVNIDQLKAEVYVNEKDVYRLVLGQSVSISSEVFPGSTFKGKISFISPKGDISHNYLVEIVIDNSAKNSLKAGTYILVKFQFDSNIKVLQIPKIALAEGMKNPYVYIITGPKARMKKITVGRDLGEYIEVVQGLQVGEQVIVSGQINLFDGSNIHIVTSK